MQVRVLGGNGSFQRAIFRAEALRPRLAIAAVRGTAGRPARLPFMFQCILFFCFLGGPGAAVVPDGAGGFVPFTNSRVMPDGSLRPYDPALDGVFGGQALGGYAAPPYEGIPAQPPGKRPGPRTWIQPYW